MKLRRKAAMLLSAAAVLLGVGVASGMPAYAGTGNQWLSTTAHTINAWDGGPFIKSYQYPAVNNDFTWVNNDSACNGGRTTSTCPGHGVPSGLAIGSLKFTGSGAWVGRCVGDESNDPNQADTSLDDCPTPGVDNGGYGTNFVYYPPGTNTCNSQLILYNIHWNGFLRIPDSNGAKIFLNNSTASCIHLQPAS